MSCFTVANFGGLDRTIRHCVFALATAMVTTGAAAQTLREDGPLLDKPDGSPTQTRLKAGTPLKPLKRQGFWVEVDAGGKTGWLKVSAVNFAGAQGPVSIDTGRTGTGNIVSTSAARGLSSKDLLEGRPNLEDANRLDTMVADMGAVAGFRTQGGIRPSAERVALSVPGAGAPSAGAGSSAGRSAGSDSPAAAQPGGGKNKKDGDDW